MTDFPEPRGPEPSAPKPSAPEAKASEHHAPEPTAGVFDGREHQLPVRIYYEDTDFTGIVYHANYLRYLERGRSDFFRAVGVSHTELAQQDTGFAVIRMELDFKRAARIDDALVVRTLFERAEGVRLHVRQTITRGEEVLFEAQVVAVCISLSGRPRRPTPDMLAKLAPWLRPESEA